MTPGLTPGPTSGPSPGRASPTAAAHADAVALLGAWAAPDAGQAALRDRYLGHLGAYPDALDRHGPPAHLTASCLVLDEAGEHVLLVLHRKGRFWVQPGGHVEPGDRSLAAAALREAREETGLGAELVLRTGAPADLHRHGLDAAFGRCAAHLDVLFTATAPLAAAPSASTESSDVAWWPLAALPAGVVADLPPRARRLAAQGAASATSTSSSPSPSSASAAGLGREASAKPSR